MGCWLALGAMAPWLLAIAPAATAQTLVPPGAVWRYLDDGSDQGAAWQDPAFDDTSWAEGPAELGYGDGDEVTVVGFGGNAADKYITTYFRHRFAVSDPNAFDGLVLSLKRDDGAIVYLNGAEVFRTNLPAGPVDFRTLASTAVSGAGENEWVEAPLPSTLLVGGDNLLAVEIHQSSATSSDISFDLSLTDAGPLGLVRGPYLQNGTPTSMVIRWRTNVLTESQVRFGAVPDALASSVAETDLTTEHEVEIDGLEPATRFYYSVGTATQTLAGGDADHFFVTLPTPGSRTPVRIWVVGDSGECAQNQQGCLDAAAVRDAYLGFAAGDIADAWLMVGDNAYTNGTDAQYTAGLFDVYPQVLRNTVLWPAPGNHEFGASDSPTQTGPYYESFSMPIAGEAGGLASGTEAYYSFDYGNVHFVSLDSHDTDRSVGGLMYSWLEADLMATSQDFVIVYWHHPPYTKGSHDSDDPADSGGRMMQMRERFVPLLESYGVDLQLTGHSHSYERSILLDGHYGTSGSFDPLLHAVDPGDGDPSGDGAYAKATLGPAPHQGAVYAVVGSSSKDSGALSAHPVMTVGINFEGSLVVDVDGRRLDGWFLDKNGVVGDHFRILKGAPFCSDGYDRDGDGLADHPDDPGCSDPDDETETDASLPCDDGLDNDGDGSTDFRPGGLGDPGCANPSWWREDPQCDDDLDNDGDGAVDWDGDPEGRGDGPAEADPNCANRPWYNRERAGVRRCGLGFEVALALLPVAALRFRRRSATGSRS